MKKYILILIIVTINILSTHSMNVQRNGTSNEYVSISKPDSTTGLTFKDKDGKKYNIYKTVKGKFYINRVSKKTNKIYRQYLKLNG